MNSFYTQTSAIMLGLVVGLWLRRTIMGLFTITVMAGIVAVVLIATGRGAVLEANGYLVPQAVSLSGQMVLALKQVLLSTPGTLVGLLVGVVTREVVALVKSKST